MDREDLVFQDKRTVDWLDERLFKSLFDQYWKRLYGFCMHHIPDTDDAQEIIQQVFLSLWERRDRLDIDVNIGHYLFSAVRRRIARYYRDRAFARERLSYANDFCEETNNTEETILFNDIQRYIDSLVHRLPCRCQQVYTLSRNSGLTIPEIARQLGISEKTAEAHLTKALKILKAAIKSA